MAPTETNNLVVILPHAHLWVTRCTILRLWFDSRLSLLLWFCVLLVLLTGVFRKVDSMNLVSPGENIVHFLRIRPTDETRLLLATAPAMHLCVLV